MISKCEGGGQLGQQRSPAACEEGQNRMSEWYKLLRVQRRLTKLLSLEWASKKEVAGQHTDK